MKELKPDYRIVSEIPDASIPDGFTRINAVVTNRNRPVAYANIHDQKDERIYQTDSNGYVSFLVPETDSILYMTAASTQEIVLEHDFKNQHQISIEFYAKYAPRVNEPIMVYKPVIYTYAPKSTEVSLELFPKGDFTFTYPLYENNWSFTAQPTGNIEIGNKEYPYLFWEAEQLGLTFVHKDHVLPNAYQLNTDTIVPFLENTLEKLGLSTREQTDFITFWGPKLQQQENVLLQFLIDEQYDETIAGLSISPKPDCIRRVYLLYTALSDAPANWKLNPIDVAPLTRNGLTVIEWGGSVLPAAHLQLP